MKKKFFILLILVLIIGFILILWWNQANKPINREDNAVVIFKIERGETVRNIAERLQKQNLIRSSVAFFLLTRFSDIADNIQAGEFRLSPSMNLYTLASNLTHGTVDVQVTIPEGWRNEEIAIKLTKELSIPEKEYLRHAREGYMFPDTYLIPKDASVSGITQIFLANFNKKVSSDLIDRAKQKNLKLNQLITIASLVEREAKYTEDRIIVAGVILNRLKLGMKLDVDATVQYALGYQSDEKTWWKRNLTIEDLEIDSPYNTYQHAGLPPSPIANPGLSSIKAVIDAPETEYLYYISDKSGKIHVAKNINEHNQNISKYLN
jgi:UPF0755 protein